MEYLIRNFEGGDIAQLIQLCEEHAAFEQSTYDPDGKHASLKSQLLGPTPALHCWVVVANELLVGYVTYTIDFSTWDAAFFLHVDCLFLRPQFRGLGIGKELMGRLANVARENKCVNMQWQTPASNARAIKFYEQIGAHGVCKMRFFMNTQPRY